MRVYITYSTTNRSRDRQTDRDRRRKVCLRSFVVAATQFITTSISSLSQRCLPRDADGEETRLKSRSIVTHFSVVFTFPIHHDWIIRRMSVLIIIAHRLIDNESIMIAVCRNEREGLQHVTSVSSMEFFVSKRYEIAKQLLLTISYHKPTC